MTDQNEIPGVAQGARETFDQWFDDHFLDPDGGSAHLPDWLKDDLKLAWDAALAAQPPAAPVETDADLPTHDDVRGILPRSSADSVELERAIEQLLFSKITSGRMVGFTVTVAHEIMGLIRNIGCRAQPQRGQVTTEQAAIDVARESKTKEERDRLDTKAIGDRSDWPTDGFINDYD